MKARLLRIWTYFRRGHAVYLAFVISFMNFIVIQYRLLIEQIPMLSFIFSHLYLFAIMFVFVYIPISAIIGWIDYKRGSVPVDQEIAAQVNPWAIDLAKAIQYLAQGENDKATQTLEKWTGS